MESSRLNRFILRSPLHDSMAEHEGQASSCRWSESGWDETRSSGSHRTLAKPGFQDFVFAFHDSDEIGPRMLARIGKRTGLRPQDL